MASGFSAGCSTSNSLTINDEQVSKSNINAQPLIVRVCDTAVERFRSSVRFSQFAKHYPEIHKKDPEALREFYDQYVNNLSTKLSEQFNQIMEKHNVISLLDQLSEIEKSQTDRSKTAWRPSGNPDRDVEPHLVAIKLKHREKLTNTLEDLKAKCSVAKAENEKSQQELNNLKQKLDEQLAKFELAASACQKLPRMRMDAAIATCEQSLAAFDQHWTPNAMDQP